MEKEKRERWIKVRVSETEKSVIDEKSRLAGVTTAENQGNGALAK